MHVRDGMTQTEAPYGTFGTIGHPLNRCYIVKTMSGFWRYANSGSPVNDEDFRAGWDILYVPDE
jgi:hypothetical protein